MKTVKQILENKGEFIYTVNPNLTVYEAIRVMGEHNIGSVLVMEDEKLVGILTERDYARKIVLKGKFSATTFVHEIMTPHPGLHTVTLESDIEDCMKIMSQYTIRHLPVLDENGNLHGIISIGDVVSNYINQQKEIIEDMTTYLYNQA